MAKKAVTSREKRSHERQKCALGLKLDDASGSHYTQLRNIGRGGAYIETFIESPYQIGQELILTIAPNKEEDQVVIKGQIAWCNFDGIGIKFLNLPSDLETFLQLQ